MARVAAGSVGGLGGERAQAQEQCHIDNVGLSIDLIISWLAQLTRIDIC